MKQKTATSLDVLRCYKCESKLAEFAIEAGEVRIMCHKRICKAMNIVVVRPIKKESTTQISENEL